MFTHLETWIGESNTHTFYRCCHVMNQQHMQSTMPLSSLAFSHSISSTLCQRPLRYTILSVVPKLHMLSRNPQRYGKDATKTPALFRPGSANTWSHCKSDRPSPRDKRRSRPMPAKSKFLRHGKFQKLWQKRMHLHLLCHPVHPALGQLPTAVRLYRRVSLGR